MKKTGIRQISIIVIAAFLAIIFSFPALAKGGGTWKQDEKGWWYEYGGPSGRGRYPASQWLQIGSEWYYFDENGYMKTGWVETDGKQYYLDETRGAMLSDTTAILGGVKYEFDSTGAAASEWPYKSPVVIPPQEQKSDVHKALDSMCDNVLSGIINDSMGDREKATAIYSWIRSNFRYNGHSATRDWVQEAHQGIRKHRGDCYTYFAVSQALLTRAGLPSIEVIRNTDNDHYWNLTKVDGVWYHFDTTPRSWGGTFCLLTDAQMEAYSAAHGWCFAFDKSLYPPSP